MDSVGIVTYSVSTVTDPVGIVKDSVGIVTYSCVCTDNSFKFVANNVFLNHRILKAKYEKIASSQELYPDR